jgi:hypothetical protein
MAFSANGSDSTKIKYSLGITPSAIINLVTAIQLSQELSFKKIFTLGLESGFVFSHGNVNNENTRGFRIRPELRFKVLEKHNFDIDLFLFYNYRYYKATRVVEVNKGNFAYIEEARGDRKTTLTGKGIGVDFGIVNLGDFIKKVNIGLGVGFGNINNIYSDEIFETQSIFFIGSSASGTIEIPILILNVNLYFM